MATGLPSGFGMYSLPTMGPENKQIFDMIKGHFQGGAGDVFQRLFGMAGGKGEAFQQLEVPARRELDQNLANIGMQFGLSGSNKSSGFQNAITGAGQNFQEGLYGQRANLMQKSMQDVLGLGNMLLGTPTQQFGIFEKENLLREIMQMLGSAGGQMAGMYGGSKLAMMGK